MGLDLKDRAVIQSMMRFTACCTEGNMDEAFKAIKQIKRCCVYLPGRIILIVYIPLHGVCIVSPILYGMLALI